MRGAAAAVSAYIAQGQSSGDFDSELDATTTAALLMWMTERGLAKLVADAADEELGALADSLTEIFWRTLRGGRAA